MPDPLSLVAALVLCLAIVAGLVLHERQFWRLLLDDQRRTIADLTNRLLAAQDAGKIIPPSDLAVVESEPDIAIDPAIEEWIGQWEDPNVQARWRGIARTYLVAGLSVTATIKALEERLAR